MDQDAIVVEGLQKSYGSVKALRGVDFSARTGTVLGLLGPNGAGTTAELVALAREIAGGVEERFGIRLVPEPVFVGHEW